MWYIHEYNMTVKIFRRRHGINNKKIILIIIIYIYIIHSLQSSPKLHLAHINLKMLYSALPKCWAAGSVEVEG